jgi:uncharacterized protein (TIGR02391 family)
MMIELEHLRSWPAATLAFALLPGLDSRRAFVLSNQVVKILQRADATSQGASDALGFFERFPDESTAIAAAFEHLQHEGILVRWPPTTPTYPHDDRGQVLRMTAWGRRVQAQGHRAADLVRARRRIGVELHPKLAGELRDFIAVGAFETVASRALTIIEVRVRELSKAPPKNGRKRIGADLMRYAFSPKGPLANRDAEDAENTGRAELFAGTFGAVRNVLAHNEVEWSDSIEAAEYVLLCDLLMRILDRVEREEMAPFEKGVQ